MKKWVTQIEAIDPLDGALKTWGGQYVEAPTFSLAEKWCVDNAGYLKVIGELIAEVDEDTGDITDFENTQWN